MNESATEIHGDAAATGGTSGGGILPINTDGMFIDTASSNGQNGLSLPLPFQQKIVLIPNTRVAGTTHVQNIDEIVEGLNIDDVLELLREKENTADPYAILVLSKGVKIGYICADCNEILARLMDGGKSLEARLTSIEKIGNWNKLGLEVYLND